MQEETTRLTDTPTPGADGQGCPAKGPGTSKDPEQGQTAGTAKQAVSKKPSVQIREPPHTPSRQVSRQVSGLYSGGGRYTVVKVEEKHGALHNAIPCMPLPLAIICCILNILAPGLGTLVASPTVFCCGSTRIGRPLVAFGLNLVSGVGQMLTFLLIVGWIWSILWGMTFVQLALTSKQAALPSPVPYYVRRQSSVE